MRRLSKMEQARLAEIHRKMQATPTATASLAPVIWTATYSCGCTTSPRDVLEVMEARGPGDVILCDTHDDYAICTRVTMRLVEDKPTLEALFTAAGCDDPDYLAAVALTPINKRI